VAEPREPVVEDDCVDCVMMNQGRAAWAARVNPCGSGGGVRRGRPVLDEKAAEEAAGRAAA